MMPAARPGTILPAAPMGTAEVVGPMAGPMEEEKEKSAHHSNR